MKQELKMLALRLLDNHRVMTIATNRSDGWPQATMVGYANDGFLLYSFISSDSQKYDNILRDPRVSVAIGSDAKQPLDIKGLSLAGRAELVEDRAEYNRVVALMRKRYPEYASLPEPDPHDAPLLRITPRIMSVLDYSKGFGHTDLVIVSPHDIEEVVESGEQLWAGQGIA